jgi:Trk-type K+ transport system membrane component
MDLLFWLMLGFVVIGFVVLVSMKKSMERKVASIKSSKESTIESTKPIIWWIMGTTVWGIVSITLIVWWFSITMS